MKFIRNLALAAAACLAALAAQAADPVWTLYRGTTIVKPRVDYPTLQACDAAVPKKGSGSYTCRTSVAVPIDPTPPGPTWAQVAVEGGTFVFVGTRTVRYGASTAVWVVKDVQGGGQCTNAFFGSDPAVGVVKACEVSSVVPPQPPLMKTCPDGAVIPATDVCPIHMHGGLPVSDPSTWPKQTFLPIDYEALSTGNPIPPQSVDSAAFRTRCFYTHMSFNDPIVYPGQKDMAHHHTFYGNAMIDEKTTAANIRAPGNASSCRGGTANLTGYWHPSLIDTATNKPIAPEPIIVYYKDEISYWMLIGQPPARALPDGLRMIAGNPSNAVPEGVTGQWSCFLDGDNGVERLQGPTIPTACVPGEYLRVKINFPQCWDGVNLDSPDHKSHMAAVIKGDGSYPGYAAGHEYACPKTHPVLLPLITEIIQWPVQAGVDQTKLRLSSDAYDATKPGGYSIHADWFNGWKPEVAATWGQKCMQERRDCGSATLGDGRSLIEQEGN